MGAETTVGKHAPGGNTGAISFRTGGLTWTGHRYKTQARHKHIVAEAGLETATAVVLAVEAEAKGRWDGPSKRAVAEQRLREMGLAFAIPYLEQAVAYCQTELAAIADKYKGAE